MNNKGASTVHKGAKAEKRAPKRLMFIDTETECIKEEDGMQYHELFLGCLEVWEVNSYGLPVKKTYTECFRDIGRIYEIMLDNNKDDWRLVCHNWNFDAAALKVGSKEMRSKYGYDIDCQTSILPSAGDGFAPFKLTLDFEKFSAFLICNTNFYKSPLAKIAPPEMPKMDMPDKTEYSDYEEYQNDLEMYCWRDVEILRKAWFEIFEMSQELGDTTPGFTAAMAAFRIFKNGFLDYKMYSVQGSRHIPQVDKAEYLAYRGGRCDTFWRGKPPAGTTAYKYDLNSEYPSIMQGSVPFRYSHMCGDEEFMWDFIARDKDAPDSSLTFLAEVTVNIPTSGDNAFIGLDGVKNEEGQLIFPVGRYKTWLWQPMLEIGKGEGWIEEVHTIYCYESAPIFREYVETLYNKRIEYRKAGDEGKAQLCKLLMNSLYGKFGQRYTDNWVELGEDTDEYLTHALPPTQDITVWDAYYGEEGEELEKHYFQIGERLFTQVLAEDSGIPQASRGAVRAIAGYITSAGRALLWRGMAEVLAGGGQLYQCDTDSIMASVQLPADMVDDTRLGAWKLEATMPAEKCTFVAPKHYQFGNQWKIKGIRQGGAGTAFTQIVFPNFTTDLMSSSDKRRQRLEVGAVLSEITKTVSGDNNKRIVVGEGLPTNPICVNIE